MRYQNFLEPHVEALTEKFLADVGEPEDTTIKDDMVVYALNRLPPHYATSGRGILYSMRENESPQSTVDILRTLAEAYEVITSRRKTDQLRESIPLFSKGLYLLYPRIAGIVYAAETFTRIESARVSILENGELLPALSNGFPNPYEITAYDKGHYIFSFLPRKVKRPTKQTVTVTVAVDAEKYAPYRGYLKFNVESLAIEDGSPPLNIAENTYSVDNVYLRKESRSWK